MQTLELLNTGTAASQACLPPGDAGLLPKEAAERHAALFRALSDPVRVRLLAHIAAAEHSSVCACHLPELVGISQPTLSHHLRKLMDAGLIDREMKGRWAHYTIRAGALVDLKGFLAGIPDTPRREDPVFAGTGR